MRLSLILESPQQQAEQLAQRLGLSSEQVVLRCNKVSKKYWKWVLQQWYGNKINLPDDAPRAKEILTRFATVSPRLLPSQKEINQYKNLEEIQQVVDDLEGVQASSKTHNLSKYIGQDGVKVVQKKGPYVTLEISDVKALKELGEGTKWCTRGSHPDCKAEYYIETFGKVYIIFQNGRPVLQYAPYLIEIKDIDNNNVTDRRLLDLIPVPDLSSGAMTCYNYAARVIRDRWPEAEPIIMKHPGYALAYTEHVINSRIYSAPLIRWTEAEPYIMRSPEHAWVYAHRIIQARWAEAEPYIKEDPECAWMYVRLVINEGGIVDPPIRWIEAEPYIMRSPEYAYRYARFVINSEEMSDPPIRWTEAEPYIAEDPASAYLYVKDILNRDWTVEPPIRWPLAEPYIEQNSEYWGSYCRQIFGKYPDL